MDAVHTRQPELDRNKTREVEMPSLGSVGLKACRRGITDWRCDLIQQFRTHVRSNLIALPPYRRAYQRGDLTRACIAHRLDCGVDDPTGRPTPSGVAGADDIAARFGQQQWQAVGGQTLMTSAP